ncbi:Thioredoxin superfamily protein [Canna indica]|uniref:Thioredoxin superfamily protein n=1 Tax=Canna indica TaxID=4628 RepID=A0AAQ3JZT0_9LILI|nr:Thioredoxin superfamily protein [Canna indica]
MEEKACFPASSTDATLTSSSSYSSSSSTLSSYGAERIRRKIAESPVVLVGRAGCCMCLVARRLLLEIGVNPAVLEIRREEEADIEVLCGSGRQPRVDLPVVFVGGRLLGGIDRLFGAHIAGELVPMLKEVGALWL